MASISLVKGWEPTKCDKCGGKVHAINDALLLDVVVRGELTFLNAFSMSRHLAPVDGCEGSPSRFQYLGGPRDTRGYDYDEEHAKKVQAAHAAIKEILC